MKISTVEVIRWSKLIARLAFNSKLASKARQLLASTVLQRNCGDCLWWTRKATPRQKKTCQEQGYTEKNWCKWFLPALPTENVMKQFLKSFGVGTIAIQRKPNTDKINYILEPGLKAIDPKELAKALDATYPYLFEVASSARGRVVVSPNQLVAKQAEVVKVIDGPASLEVQPDLGFDA